MPTWDFTPEGVVERSHLEINVPLSDPRFAEIVSGGYGLNVAGEHVNEWSAMGSTAIYRAVSILANTIAGLPLKSYRTDPLTGARQRVASLLDDPAKQWYTPFEWAQIVMTHLVLHGNSYLLHIYGGAGQLVGLFPVHPDMVQVTWKRDAGGQAYRNYCFTWSQLGPNGDSSVTKLNYTSDDVTHIMGLSSDGLRGISPLRVGRNAIATGLAADKTAAKVFQNGIMVSAVASVPGINAAQRDQLSTDLNSRLTGRENSGKIAVINASATLSPWTVNAEDAQFLESRQFQVEEVARMFGIPKVLLAQDGASTWGSGIAELDKGMAKYTFTGYTRSIEDRLSELLYGSTRHVEFDYSGLFRGTPDEEAQNLASLVTAGLYTVDEARAILNLPPLGASSPPPANPTEGS